MSRLISYNVSVIMVLAGRVTAVSTNFYALPVRILYKSRAAPTRFKPKSCCCAFNVVVRNRRYWGGLC
jgi:hypothetical protein